VRSVVLAVAGSILLVAGWFVLSWGVVNLAASGLSMGWRFLIEAALNLGAGGVLLLLARRKTPQPDKSDEPERREMIET
jgi:predicted phage tail protein